MAGCGKVAVHPIYERAPSVAHLTRHLTTQLTAQLCLQKGLDLVPPKHAQECDGEQSGQ